MHIYSTLAHGNGAHVLHQMLAAGLPGYQLQAYPPRHTFCPPLLYRYRNRRAHCVHAPPDYAVFAVWPRQPLVVTFHGYTLDAAFHRHASWLQQLHYRTDLRYFTAHAAARAQAVVAVSHFLADLIRHDLPHSGPVRVIHNGVDTDRFQPRPHRPGTTVRILFSGNLTRSKGAWLLPAIAAQLQPGMEIHYTQGLRTPDILAGQPRLHALGCWPHDQMHTCYQQMDILLAPTLREGFGLGIAEAMACGLPIVASDTSALPELVVQGQGGFLCPVGDAACFAHWLNHLASDARLRRHMGEFNRARACQLFNLPRMVQAYRELFVEVLDVSHHPADLAPG